MLQCSACSLYRKNNKVKQKIKLRTYPIFSEHVTLNTSITFFALTELIEKIELTFFILFGYVTKQEFTYGDGLLERSIQFHDARERGCEKFEN